MGKGPGKTKMKMSDFHFKPVKTLFGNPSTEKIAGWRTKVYEATGKLVAVTTAKTTVVSWWLLRCSPGPVAMSQGHSCP